MTHFHDDDLILHFYGEQPPDVAARIDAHLRACGVCDEAWRELRETLQLVDTARVPEPGPAFERVIWARVAPALEPVRPWWTSWRWLAPAAGIAAAVVAAIFLQPIQPASPEPAATGASATVTTARPSEDTDDNRSRRILFSALNDHFAQTEVLLVELMNGPEAGRELDFERGAAGELLADGRLYRLTAEQTGERHLVAMLDDLESVLVEVARSPETVQRKDMKVLRSRIDEDGLLFKVRAVTHEIRERRQEMITASNEG